MQVESFLELSAARSPEKTALVCSGRRFTYGEMEAGANRLGGSLIAGGVERGDRVAIYLENSAEAVISVFAILKAGAVFLVVNPTTKADKASCILNKCRALGLITDRTNLGTLSDSVPDTPQLQGVWVAGGMPGAEVATAKSLREIG